MWCIIFSPVLFSLMRYHLLIICIIHYILSSKKSNQFTVVLTLYFVLFCFRRSMCHRWQEARWRMGTKTTDVVWWGSVPLEGRGSSPDQGAEAPATISDRSTRCRPPDTTSLPQGTITQPPEITYLLKSSMTFTPDTRKNSSTNTASKSEMISRLLLDMVVLQVLMILLPGPGHSALPQIGTRECHKNMPQMSHQIIPPYIHLPPPSPGRDKSESPDLWNCTVHWTAGGRFQLDPIATCTARWMAEDLVCLIFFRPVKRLDYDKLPSFAITKRRGLCLVATVQTSMIFTEDENCRPLHPSTDFTTTDLLQDMISGTNKSHPSIKTSLKTQCTKLIEEPLLEPLAREPQLPTLPLHHTPNTWPLTFIITWAEPPQDRCKKCVTHKPSQTRRTPSGKTGILLSSIKLGVCLHIIIY